MARAALGARKMWTWLDGDDPDYLSRINVVLIGIYIAEIGWLLGFNGWPVF